ncbi:CRISPR-associated endoribonuclease Cas6 [Caldisericum exile]|uniref:CRISPR-associated endoribonuclease n=1 Tax=Caldisericum exile (strain DSM 21853 / NBRC 104410 / AZM16c01) TaxID=511051 RepID=A0A7U6GDK3_CALEA|nr:CRISPR-associated endoribonuclease Cas6 [Caldisericum exile]BAL80386.1 putative CRISPR-associated protein [Caldisericum exile AZM16c01]
MRIKLTFEDIKGREIILPIHYGYLLHYLVYNTFSEGMAQKLYLEGFPIDGKKFKLFTFSNIIEKGTKFNNTLNFGKYITFYFSSPLYEIVEDLGSNAFRKTGIVLNDFNLFLSAVEVIKPPRLTDDILIRTLSPITAYSTFNNNGKRTTHYYRPTESEFKRLIEENAQNKYILIKKAQGLPIEKDIVNDLHLDIEPYKFSIEKNKKVVYFKNTIVECFSGIYRLKGSPELIYTTYDAGLGAKSSEGFGMWDVWEKG